MHNYNSLVRKNTAPRCSKHSSVSKSYEPECEWSSSEPLPRWREAEEHGKTLTPRALPSCEGITAAGSALREMQEKSHGSCHLSAPRARSLDLKGKEGSTQEHTDGHLLFTAQSDPELLFTRHCEALTRHGRPQRGYVW